MVIPVPPRSLHDLYHKAKVTNGNLDRNQGIWEEYLNHQRDIVYAYLIGSDQPKVTLFYLKGRR